MPTRLDWTNLAEDYRKLGTIRLVADKYGCAISTVSRWKKRSQIPTILENYWRYKVNVDFFKIWSPELAYLLGFTAADGCVMPIQPGQRGGGVRWQINDLDLLQQIRRVIDSTHPIKKVRFKAFELRIYNKEIYKRLVDLGISHNKTFNLNPLDKVPRYLYGHLARGYFDGDGTISYNKNPAQKCFTSNIACASKDFIYWLQKIIPTKGGSLFKRKTYYVLAYGRWDTIRLGEFMYKNSTIHLQRKYKRFKLAGLKL